MSWSEVDETRRRRGEEPDDERDAARVYEELSGPKKKTEVDVIKEWLVNIFQPVEKTADMVVTDFKFEQIVGSGGGAAKGISNGSTNGKNGVKNGSDPQVRRANHFVKAASNGGGSANREASEKESDDGAANEVEEQEMVEDPTFRVLKRAEVRLRVAKSEKEYSEVIKVLPTDDPERHTDAKKFGALLEFAKEVQVRGRGEAKRIIAKV